MTGGDGRMDRRGTEGQACDKLPTATLKLRGSPATRDRPTNLYVRYLYSLYMRYFYPLYMRYLYPYTCGTYTPNTCGTYTPPTSEARQSG